MQQAASLCVLGNHNVAFGLTDAGQKIDEPRGVDIKWLAALDTLKLYRLLDAFRRGDDREGGGVYRTHLALSIGRGDLVAGQIVGAASC